MAMPTWIREVQALSTPVIAGVAGYIAYQQFRLAREKLRLDLFDRRFRIYRIILQAMIDALNFRGPNALDESTAELNRALREGRFLFDVSIYAYFDKIETAVIRYRGGREVLVSAQNGLTSIDQNYLEEHHKDGKWLLENLRVLPTRLAPYLKLDDKISVSSLLDFGAPKQI